MKRDHLITDKYSSHGSAQLKHDSRKRTRDERDDRDVKKGSTLTRKIIRTDDRSRPVKRSIRISSPTHKAKKYVAPALNEYLDAYDNQPKKHLEEKTKIYPQPKVYESKPVSYVDNEHRNIENQPTFNEHKPKVPRIQEINPKVQDVIEATMPEEKSLSVADRTRPFRFNELNPLMNSMVEDELKNMMVYLVQSLPRDATTDTEKFVLDKIKNEALDDLRNTMGLNVTKRLLNVTNESSHKGLLIKIQMHISVSSRDVYEFCEAYKIKNLKNIQPRVYAGRVLNWTHLDELYSVKELTCGKSKVTITPIYNFLKCPPMLKTVFDGKQHHTSKEREKGAATITANTVLAGDTKKKEAKKEIISKDKATDKKADKITPKKTDFEESPKNVPLKKAEDKKPATKPSKTANVQKETLKQNSTKTDPKVTNAKPTEAAVMKEAGKGGENKQARIPKTATKEPAKTAAKEPPKTVAKEPAKTANTEPAKPTAKEPAKPIAKEPATPIAKKPAKPIAKEPTKPIVKEAAKPIAKEPVKTIAKEPAKPNAKEPAKPIVKEPAKAPAKPNAKEPIKPITKEPIKPITKEPAKPIVKEPAKPIAKAPAKPNAKEPIKPITKEPIKPITKEPAKPIVKEPAKPIANESTKPITKEAKPVASKPAPVKKETLVTPKPPEKKTVDAKAKNNRDDFDELSDHDILALLSSGIVLDACSGSDDD